MKKTTSTLPERRIANRQLILETAIKLGTEEGWKKLTVRNLASRLSYTPPVLYQFFENKEHLTKAIVEFGFDELNANLQNALDSRTTPPEKLLEFSKARHQFATQHKALHALMFSPGAPDWHKQMLSKNIQRTHKIVHSLMQSLTGRTDNCNDLVLNLICLIKGYTFFCNEIYPGKHRKEIMGELEPSKAFEDALVLFIKAIQADE